MGTIEQEMDLEDFQGILDSISEEIRTLVNTRYSSNDNISMYNKKLELYERIEGLKRRIDLY
jgi:hypothetical protein